MRTHSVQRQNGRDRLQRAYSVQAAVRVVDVACSGCLSQKYLCRLLFSKRCLSLLYTKAIDGVGCTSVIFFRAFSQ